MSAVDHAEGARLHIEWAHEQQERDGEYEYSVRDNATLAIAEATLALAEQQRIANIITWTTANGFAPSNKAQDEIVEGLGL